MIGKVAGIQYTLVEVVAFSQMTLNLSIGPAIHSSWIQKTFYSDENALELYKDNFTNL